MKRGVYPPEGRWELQADRTGINDSLNFEWPNIPGSKLPRVHLEWQIPGKEPYLLSWGVFRGRGTTAVGLSLGLR